MRQIKVSLSDGLKKVEGDFGFKEVLPVHFGFELAHGAFFVIPRWLSVSRSRVAKNPHITDPSTVAQGAGR